MHHQAVVHDAARNLDMQDQLANTAQRRSSEQTTQRVQEGEIPLHEAQAKKAMADANTPIDSTAKTVVTAEGVRQWNPDTNRYDISVGGAPGKTSGAIQHVTAKDGTVYILHPDKPAEAVTLPGGAPLITQTPGGPEAERPLPNVDQMNQALTARYQVLHPGQPLAPHYTLPATATIGDYNRVHQALQGEESAHAAKFQADATKSSREEASGFRTDAAQDRQEGQLFKQSQELGKPHQSILKTESAKLQALEQAQSLLSSGNAEGAALAVPKILSAIAGGQGSGLRMTQAELNSIAQARGISGSLEAWLSKLQSGKNLSSAQVIQLQGILADAKQRAQMRSDVANHAIDRMGSADKLADLKHHDAYARAYNSALDQGLAVAWDTASYGRIKSGQRYFDSDSGDVKVKK
jgi:hypothetical protein